MKRYLWLITLLLCSTIARADFSNAVSLAQQAGAIAGAASACGQDISLLSSRLQEAFNVMVPDDLQRSKVMMTYLQSFNNAKEMENAKAKIPCEQVLKDYNNLPILKADYQQTVLPGLLDIPAATAQVPTPQQAPQQATPLATSPHSQQAVVPGATVPMTSPSIPALATPGTAPAQTIPAPDVATAYVAPTPTLTAPGTVQPASPY